jgi:hypothetical protein
VTKDGTTFRVSQNSRAWPARVIRADTNHDICRLKVTGLQVIPVQLRTSDHLAVGERVVALGSPQGLELTISEGIISGIRDLSGGDRLLQTTAAISHGSSGGGLFDGQGRLVGITTLYLAESQNLNFAVPAEVASATGLGGPPAKGIPDRPRDERPQPERQPSASLVVTTDLDCYWTLDGVSQPELKAGDTKTVKVSSGEHLVEANTPSGWDSWQTVVTIGRGGRELIQIPLSSVRQERQEKEQKEVAESRRAEERKREEERKRAEGRKREQQQDNERYKFVFASIPAGEFDMGCSPNDKWCVPGEWPRHPVRISRGFEIGKYEVTQAMWESVMHNNPSHFTGADRPVERVSWYDVMKFLLLLNDRHDGYYYRLPTEAEWEYAARASSRSDHYGKLDAIAWYKDNSGGQTHPVGQKQPNAWGHAGKRWGVGLGLLR